MLLFVVAASLLQTQAFVSPQQLGEKPGAHAEVFNPAALLVALQNPVVTSIHVIEVRDCAWTFTDVSPLHRPCPVIVLSNQPSQLSAVVYSLQCAHLCLYPSVFAACCVCQPMSYVSPLPQDILMSENVWPNYVVRISRNVTIVSAEHDQRHLNFTRVEGKILVEPWCHLVFRTIVVSGLSIGAQMLQARHPSQT